LKGELIGHLTAAPVDPSIDGGASGGSLKGIVRSCGSTTGRF
jgi:hypothetical protein